MVLFLLSVNNNTPTQKSPYLRRIDPPVDVYIWRTIRPQSYLSDKHGVLWWEAKITTSGHL